MIITLKRLITVKLLMLASIMLASILMASCTIVKIQPEAETSKRNVISSGEMAVDAAEYLSEHLEATILPEIDERKVSLSVLIDAAKSGWDAAGDEYGERKGDIGAKYNFITYSTATVADINTESRNGFILVELDEKQTNYVIKISIGPVLRGTSIRDSIRFVDFNHFVNQMDYAELANALNRYGNENVLQNIDTASLVGKTIEFTGSFTEPEGDEISIMPIFMEVKLDALYP